MLVGVGSVLLFSGIKNEDPRQLVVDVLSGKRALKTSTAPSSPPGASKNSAGINNGTTGTIPDPTAGGLGAIAGATGAAYHGSGSPPATSAYSPLTPHYD